MAHAAKTLLLPLDKSCNEDESTTVNPFPFQDQDNFILPNACDDIRDRLTLLRDPSLLSSALSSSSLLA